MKKIIIKLIVWSIKGALFYYIGLFLGLGSFDPESSFLYQNWKVWVFLYLPLAMGFESLLVTLIEVIEESRKEKGDGKETEDGRRKYNLKD